MVELFDREKERNQIREILENEQINYAFTVWIEGIEGSGKTQFLKYLIEKTNIFIFDFSDFESIYKCEKINAKNEFSYISNIVFKVLKEHPHKFQAFLQDYFDDQNRITFLDAGCLVLPQLKIFSPIQKLFETKYNVITKSQGNVTDKLVNTQLVDFFSDIIVYYFENIKSDVDHFMCCIDDMHWIDNSSLKTLNSILNKINKKSLGFNLSLSITIRNSKALTPDEKNTYNSVYKIIENHYNKIFTIVMNNFDFNLTRQLIVSKKRYFLEENVQKIFELTNGNPMELIQTLRFSDDEVKRILENNTGSYSLNFKNSSFSQEMLFNLYSDNENNVYILNILAVLGCTLSKNLIIKIANNIAVSVYNSRIITISVVHAIDDLTRKGIIEKSIDGFSISQHYMKTLVVEYLSNTGEYKQYVEVIADILLQENLTKFSKIKSNIYFALNLLKTVDAKKAFEIFVNTLNNSTTAITGELYEIGAECFCLDIANISIEVINEIVIAKMLPSLFSSGRLKTANKLSEYVFDLRFKLSPSMYIQYLFYYIKTLIEMSVLISNENIVTATSLFNELQNVEVPNKEMSLQILLLGMSIYEHLLDFKKINTLYDKADKILQFDNDITSSTLAKFYRNKGLIFSHRALINDYKKAYRYSCKIDLGNERQVMRGTTLNNLGLAYFYSGFINKALICFLKATDILNSISCETSRIYNNIAICYFVLGNIELAYVNMSDALTEPLDGNFISTGIKTNYALILNELDKTDKAIEILDSLIDIYYSEGEKCKDEVVYSAALLNRAYIHICKNEYLDAIKLIKESTKQTYRFEHELQQKKRIDMINYCLEQENLISSINVDIDFNNESFDVFKKPYSLMPFAYYVI